MKERKKSHYKKPPTETRTEKVQTESFINAENTVNEPSVKYKYTTVAYENDNRKIVVLYKRG